MSEYRARITPEGKILYLQTELDALRAENQALKTEIATRIERIEAMTVLLCQEAARGQGMMGKPFQDFIDHWRAEHESPR